MKRIFSLIIAVLFLLNGVASFADVLFVPESDFYQQHSDECTNVDRDYYINGKTGYIPRYRKPEAGQVDLVDYLKNAQKVRIFCTYKDWGMVSYLNGKSQEKATWVRMSDLYLIYDEQSFREDFADQITQSTDPLTLPENTEKVLVYQYPGAETYSEFNRNFSDLKANTRYTDSEGRIWGRIAYYQGIRSQWICFSEPSKEIEPFGGDPNLKTFEKYASEVPLPEVVPEEPEQTIIGMDPQAEPDKEITHDSGATTPSVAPSTPTWNGGFAGSGTASDSGASLPGSVPGSNPSTDVVAPAPSVEPDMPLDAPDFETEEPQPEIGVSTPSVAPDTSVSSPTTDTQEILPYNPDENKDTTVEVPQDNIVSDNAVSAPAAPTPDQENSTVEEEIFLDQKEPESESTTITPPVKEDATDIIAPEEPPYRIPMNPLVIVAIVLVAIAVIAAVVLIIVCYKRKQN